MTVVSQNGNLIIMINIIEKFKAKIKDGKPVIGPFMKSSDPMFVEASGYAGFDFAILDMEHGPVSLESMQNNIRAAQVSRMLPIIRVPDMNPVKIAQALDIGAGGIQIPQITSAQAVEQVIRATKYYPQGDRGVCRFVRAANYSDKERHQYFRDANEAIIILQIEGQEGVSNIEEILDVKGFDIVFIGPYDLSQSLGVPGDVQNPKVVEQIRYIVSRAKAKGIVVGTFIDYPDKGEIWQAAGVQYLCYSTDVGIYYSICREIVCTSIQP